MIFPAIKDANESPIFLKDTVLKFTPKSTPSICSTLRIISSVAGDYQSPTALSRLLKFTTTMITHHTSLKSTHISKTQSNCASCPYFDDFQERSGRGWCKIMDTVARKQHKKSQVCDWEIAHYEQESIFSELPPCPYEIGQLVKVIEREVADPRQWQIFVVVGRKYNSGRYRSPPTSKKPTGTLHSRRSNKLPRLAQKSGSLRIESVHWLELGISMLLESFSKTIGNILEKKINLATTMGAILPFPEHSFLSQHRQNNVTATSN